MITKRVGIKSKVQAEPHKARKNMGKCVLCGGFIFPGQWYYILDVFEQDGEPCDKHYYVHMDGYLEDCRKTGRRISKAGQRWIDIVKRVRRIVARTSTGQKKKIRAAYKAGNNR